MYFAKKSEYNDIREKSFLQWLDEMEKHDDVAVRCGVTVSYTHLDVYKRQAVNRDVVGSSPTRGAQ